MALRVPKLTVGPADTLDFREVIRAADRTREAERREVARTMLQWSKLVPERGLPLNFEDFPFQLEWYSEEVARAREVIWMKAAQIGMSGYAWRWAARRAAEFGDRVIYFFPTDDDVTDFGDQRIEPSIQESEYLLSKIPAHFVRHKHLKRIGAGDLSLRGTTSKTAVQSVDGDALVFDEVEYHNEANLEQALRRLAGSEAAGRTPRKRWLGYPREPGGRVDSLYKGSDMRVWLVTCPECDREQEVQWANMRWRSEPDGEVYRQGKDEYTEITQVTEAWRACRDCEASLEGQPIRSGRWHRRRPERDVIGFHVSRLIVPRTDLKELVTNFRKTSPFAVEAFWRNDLGMPYVPAEAALTEEDVLAACSMGGEAYTQSRSSRFVKVAGVDCASERDLSMWIDELGPDGRQRALWIGEPLDFREVADLIGRFEVAMTVIDSMPERRQARAVAATYPGRVVLAEYDDRNDSDAFKYDPKKNMVRINRTEGIDAFMEGVRQLRRIPLRKPPPRFVSQLTSPKRRTEVSETTGKKKRVYVATGPDGDDYAHAGVYGLVAREMWNLRAHVVGAMESAAGNPIADERYGYRSDAYDQGRRY